jgi:hypothetical protein
LPLAYKTVALLLGLDLRFLLLGGVVIFSLFIQDLLLDLLGEFEEAVPAALLALHILLAGMV